MTKYGTLQIRINLTKGPGKTVYLDGPVSVHDQAAKGEDHDEKLTSGMGQRIRRRKGESDVLCQIKNAIGAAKYHLTE